MENKIKNCKNCKYGVYIRTQDNGPTLVCFRNSDIYERKIHIVSKETDNCEKWKPDTQEQKA